MSSANKTTNLKLNKWIGTDRSAREDFNNDNDLIDKFAGEVTASLKDLTTEVSQLSNPNLLINGDFQVWQRGTKFDFNKIGYSADRWFKARTFQSIEKTTTGSLKINISGATFNGAGIIQPIENSSKFIGKRLTLSVKYKTNVNLIARIANTDYTKTYAIVYDEKPTNEWKVMSCIGVIDSVMNDIIKVEISCPITQDGTFEIEWVKLELGTVSTPFIPRLYSEELLLCQRYYEKSYGDSLYPVEGQANFTNVVIISQSELEGKNIHFRVEKRINPTLKIYSPQTGKEGKVASWIKNGSSGSRYYDISYRAHYVGTKTVSIQSFNIDSPVTGTVTNARFHWIADAEIY